MSDQFGTMKKLILTQFRKSYTKLIGFCFQINQFNSKSKFLNNTLMNGFQTFFLTNQLYSYNDNNPPRMSEYLKDRIKWHNKIYAKYRNENNESVDNITLQNAKNQFYNIPVHLKNILQWKESSNNTTTCNGYYIKT